MMMMGESIVKYGLITISGERAVHLDGRILVITYGWSYIGYHIEL